MNITKLARISDSAFGENAEVLKKRKADAAKAKMVSRLKAKIMDTESTDDAVAVALEEMGISEPEDVLTAVVEILASTVDDLTVQIEDSKKALGKASRAPRQKRADAQTRDAFKKKLMDTEDTDSVIQLAKEELEMTDPATVVEVVIEVLDNVITNLTNE